MATRSTVSYQDENGYIHQVYAHYDGYLSGNGKILQKNYNTYEKVKELVSIGDISSLAETIGIQHDFDTSDPAYSNMTTFYSRDRGESCHGPRLYCDFADYERNYQPEEYNYLFTQDGVWSVFIERKQDWFDLEYELNNLEEEAV